MTTPPHYHRANLKQILDKDKYSLYHWTSFKSAESILNDGYLYSKAMLFGLHYHDQPHLLTSLKKNDVVAEAKNGFINYVFLGNTNWLDYGDSYYGELCFVIRPEAILLTKEFFIFPFNTGRYFHIYNSENKTSDTRTLMDALNQKHSRFEILVRRRIKIDDKIISKIICPDEYLELIRDNLQSKRLGIVVESPNTVNAMSHQEAIELVDPLDIERNKLVYKKNEYIRHCDHIYVKTKFSNCILCLIINDSNELFDVNTNKKIGKIIGKLKSPHILKSY